MFNCKEGKKQGEIRRKVARGGGENIESINSYPTLQECDKIDHNIHTC